MQNIQQSILNLLLRQCYEYSPGNYEEVERLDVNFDVSNLGILKQGVYKLMRL